MAAIEHAFVSRLVRDRLLRLSHWQSGNCRSPSRVGAGEAQYPVLPSSHDMAVDPSLEAAAGDMKEARLLGAQSLRPDGLVEVREAPCRTKKLYCDLVGGLEVASTLVLM